MTGIYAVGIGKTKITNLARAEACDFARVELGRYLDNQINAAIKGRRIT